ncbi:MAG: phosphate regulon sensor histidine kinase PhoR [Gammaproteobacteria bacterium]|nr:phosphate regulon sensor histidine kinase PhoR [Gammaproteobacteria bacterium]
MSPWSYELPRILLLLAIVVLNSLLFGYPFLWLTLAMGIYIIREWLNLNRLVTWLRDNPEELPPQAHGIWEHVFNTLYRREKRYRSRIKQRERRLARFQESTTALPDATIILNKRGNIEWLNKRAREYLGLKNSDMGNRIENLVRNPVFVEYLQHGEYEEPLEMPSPTTPGNTLMVRIIPYGKSRRLLVARDMTRLQRLERMRRDFIANFSHELRTPLTVLRGYLESMQDDIALTDEWGEPLQTMGNQIRRMENINDDLLFLSRLENPDNRRQDEDIDVSALLVSIREDAQALSQGKHDIRLECDPQTNLTGSQNELRTAFSNLIFNAVRYTPEGGMISIRWHVSDEGNAVLEVEDTGEGIPRQHIPRLTERFYRVDAGRSREKGGTGLGLAIVKHVANRHHARLDIESRLGHGSLFRITFPAKAVIKHDELS